YNDVYRLGLAKRLPALEALVRRSALADLDMIDAPAFLTALRQAAAGLGLGPTRIKIRRTLALAAWCDQLVPALARPADEPSEVVRCGAARGAERSGHGHGG